MKSNEELNALKEEVATVSKDLRELTDEELEQVIGGEGVPPVFGPPVYESPASPEKNYFG